MSLINEALQRARQEAAARMEAEELPGTYLTAPRHMPPRSPWRQRVLLAVGLITVLAAGAWFVAGWFSDSAAGSAVAERTTPPPVVEVEASQGTDGLASGGRSSLLEGPSANDEAAEPRTAASSIPVSRPRRKDQPAIEAEVLPVAGTPETAGLERPISEFDEIPFIEPDLPDESSAAAALNGRVFVRQVDLPDYGLVELLGIAGSVAVLGDRIVGKGEFVGGFELREIEPNGVVFSGRGSTFRLRLR